MSETPRTDAAEISFSRLIEELRPPLYVVAADFTSQLEHGSIPLNAKDAGKVYGEEHGLLKQLLAQANLGKELAEAIALEQIDARGAAVQAALQKYQRSVEIPW